MWTWRKYHRLEEVRKTVEKYAYLATLKEIRENDFNLNIPRYVDTFEEEEEVDIEAVQEDRWHGKGIAGGSEGNGQVFEGVGDLIIRRAGTISRISSIWFCLGK